MLDAIFGFGNIVNEYRIMKTKCLNVFFLLLLLSSCVGNSSVDIDDNIIDNPKGNSGQGTGANEKPGLDLSNVEDYVDLGLSVKWAKWNFGAKSIDDMGDLYAWGELETKSKYISANYQAPVYLMDAWSYNGREGIGGTQWDVVAMKCKDGRRMPTEKEFNELIGYCDIECVTIGGKNYYKFTGKTGKSIYFNKDIDGFWLANADYNGTKGYATNLHDSEYNNWEYLSWYKELWKGLPIRSVQQVEVKQKPSIVLKHDYDESLKRDDFIIEIDENSVSKYAIKGCQYENNTDVGMVFASAPDVLASKEKVRNGCFLKVTNTTFRNHFTDSFKDGEVIYAVPYIRIGGVCYFADEQQIVTGSNLPRYNVGDYYPNAQNPEGVVCYTGEDKRHGRIISFEETTAKWDVSDFSSFTGALSSSSGAVNDKKISDNGHPAAYWCRRRGEGWFLPARYELSKASHNVVTINKALKAKGYPEVGGFYWSSTEYETYGSTLAYIVCLAEDQESGYNTGWSSYNTKTNNRKVRAMKSF